MIFTDAQRHGLDYVKELKKKARVSPGLVLTTTLSHHERHCSTESF